jgi:cytoskeleton protein RodZ
MDGDLGLRLREARVQRGIDLAEVAASTKIQVRFLRAIEREEWDLLPSEFYARSFVRTYAAYLDLDDVRAIEGLRGTAGVGGVGDRSPRIDPAPPQRTDARRRSGLRPRLLAAIAAVGVVALLVAVALSGQRGDSTGPPPTRHRSGGDRQQAGPSPFGQSPGRGTGATLMLTATAEVWVCLIDARGRALIDGQILGPGSEAGPYRSGGFTVSLGNGDVRMRVKGQAASIPPTPNPIGFSIDRHGAMRELPEAERPTCA